MSRLLFLELLLCVFISCSSSSQHNETQHANVDIQKRLQDINRFLVQKEMKKIKHYVDSLDMEMKVTRTGLWYKIAHEGEGLKPQFGDHVTVSYEIRLLQDGKLCYSTDSTGNKVFEIGRSQELRGINEAVLKLKESGEIDLIIPRHLGKGLMGDLDKIPPMQTLLCNLKLIHVNR